MCTRSAESAELLQQSRRLHDLFQQVIEPHRQDLWRYCRTLTRSPWDGEDLFQDTLLKAFATLPQLWHPIVPKSYLFRIATNTWIDQCRRHGDVLDEFDDTEQTTVEGTCPLELREAVESLVSSLPPRQMVIFLLTDVFGFSAHDTASMVHCSEGAVYASVQRARRRLMSLRDANGASDSPGLTSGNRVTLAEPKHEAVETIIRALNTGDVSEFLNVMSKHIHNDAAPGFQEFSRQEVRSGSGQGLAPGLHASYRNLWGRDVIVVLADTENGLCLHNVAYPIVDGDALVYFRGYYFCKELLEEASRVLSVPVQYNKPAVKWA